MNQSFSGCRTVSCRSTEDMPWMYEHTHVQHTWMMSEQVIDGLLGKQKRPHTRGLHLFPYSCISFKCSGTEAKTFLHTGESVNRHGCLLHHSCFNFNNFDYIYSECVHMRLCCHGTHVEVRWQLVGVSSLPSGYQDWTCGNRCFYSPRLLTSLIQYFGKLFWLLKQHKGRCVPQQRQLTSTFLGTNTS